MSKRTKRVQTSLRRNHRWTEERVARKQAERVEVVFAVRQVDCPGRTPGRHWIAELVDRTGHLTVPKCVAWLTDYTPTMPMMLDFLIVPFEDDRRLGYGTRMVEECRRVWPDLIYTDPVIPAGEEFHATLPDFELTDGPFTPPLAQSEVSPAVRKAMESFHGGVQLLARVAALEAEITRLRQTPPPEEYPV